MVYLGADHGGFLLKEKVKDWLTTEKIQFEDCGAFTLDPQDDYPDFAHRLTKKVVEHHENKGILFCRSGAGMQIAANKRSGIRAVEVTDSRSAQHARAHNNANVMTISADWIDESNLRDMIHSFLFTPFSGEERHSRRIEKLEQL